MNLKDLKPDLPGSWKEASRSGSEAHTFFWLNHMSPLTGIDPKRFEDEILSAPEAKVLIVRKGLVGVGGNPYESFCTVTKVAIDNGFLPPKYDHRWLDKFHKQLTETPGFERPKESDYSGDLSVMQYQNEEIAKQSFKNIALRTTKGFDVPIPGGTNLPGVPKDASAIDLINSKAYEKYMSKEYLGKYMHISKEEGKKIDELMSKENLAKMRAGLNKVQKEISKVGQEMAKSGTRYREGEYLGCPALYLEGKNPSPRPRPKPRPSLIKTDMNTGGGGGRDDSRDPLPIIHYPYNPIISLCQGLLVKKFIITGNLLMSASSLPAGNTPCYSLTQTRRKVVVYEGGKTIYITPTISNYAKEGYFHREEVEKLIKNLIARLSTGQSTRGV